jgi:hypothetical protein
MHHLVCALWIDTTRRYYSCKGPSESSPCGLMIVWTLDRWASEIYTWPHENTNWWLSFRALRHSLWDSSCSCSLTQSLCLWSSRIAAMTPLINKNEWDICDRIYPVKAFIMLGLHNCNVARSSIHRITCDDVSCFMEDTLQNRRISSHGSSSHHLWRIMTTFMLFLSIGYVCGGMYYLGVCVYVCAHMEVSHIFFI